MSSIIQTFQRRSDALPVSHQRQQVVAAVSQDQEQQTLRRRLSSLSLKIQPGAALMMSSSSSILSNFPRSKSMGEYAGSSIKKWWELGWTWILSRKPTFAKDLEMNEEETRILGCHNKGSWRHVFYKLKSEIRRLVGSHDNIGVLPQTCKYNSDRGKAYF
ncbi:hypothetical protein HS088_TW02G00004 [Tripterygium wilfordii]|uniref:Uncharacterized protein n=1 Tax=Tripterygium wilfordii TaxID=458696 RepID=A0A7J7DXU8_TRIWF|nr:uncharacterized protein LOC120009083 [Tripterygium wilfordii]KAF5750994.1 hypothetical protein HS088_TW02G00004 [Tripterygium wilfordii]